ncbi:MAG: hypothetical protein F6K11_26265 [Leptolyngbya sp. SIO3F4]|nr:hypothetical protein [Leptolyngbya sp. SIO3F4]
MGINFDIEQHKPITFSSQKIVDTLDVESHTQTSKSATLVSKALPIPPEAGQPPRGTTQFQKELPSNVLSSVRVLSPPPTEALPQSRILSPNQPKQPHRSIGLSFDHTQIVNSPQNTQPLATKSQHPDTIPRWIYQGGANSLVARVIGSAEGTRTANGQTTRAYYGHTDPGNGVWNIGTFSYQHGAHSPEDADKKQLKRLQKQGKTIAKQAKHVDLSMTLGEILNGLDLANQSPRAALEHGGYIDRLAEARHKGISESDAIIWARTYAYLDPDTGRWNAPGLGNTLTSIKRDQNRRYQAITQAFNSYHAQQQMQGEIPVASFTTTVLASNSEISKDPKSNSLDNNPKKDVSSPHAKLVEPSLSLEHLTQTQRRISHSAESSLKNEKSSEAQPVEFKVVANSLNSRKDDETILIPFRDSELSQVIMPTSESEKSSQASNNSDQGLIQS